MSLPKLDTPTTEVIVPSSQEKISIRPFLVKEEKILLMALQGEDPQDMARATKQIINNCVITAGFDIDNLEIYDLEFLLLQLRIISQGETTKIQFSPREGSECPECQKKRVVEVNLKEAKIVTKAGHDKKIAITDSVGLIMKYPNTKMLESLEKARSAKSLDDLFKIIWGCVDSIYDAEKLYKASETKVEEGVRFIENLNSEQFGKIESFFQTMPKLTQTIHIKCGLCDFKQDYTLEGLESFFG